MSWLCNVSAVVDVHAELDELSINDVNRCEDRIVSQGRDFSADQKSRLNKQFNEILSPLGCETRLVVIKRVSSTALYFICLTLAALMGLRDRWCSGQLRRIIQSLFRFLSGDSAVVVKRLTWRLTDYGRCLEYLSSIQGKALVIAVFVSMIIFGQYRKTSNRSPPASIRTFHFCPRLVLVTWLLLETRLLFKHCQLAILNFSVYSVRACLYTTKTFALLSVCLVILIL